MVLSIAPVNMAKPLSTEERQKAQRLADIFAEFNLVQAEVATRLKYKGHSLVNKYINGKQEISEIFLRKLQDAYGISSTYIETGKGSKRVKESSNENNTYVAEPDYPYQGRTDYNVIRQISSDKPNMWVVPIKAQAGFAKGFIGRTFAGQIQQVPWPLIQGECFCFEIEGFSMFPDFKPHDYVICTLIADYDWLKPGKAYVFQTFDGIIIKCYDRVEDGKVYLTSINPDAEKVSPIEVDELRVVYAIEGKYLKM